MGLTHMCTRTCAHRTRGYGFLVADGVAIDNINRRWM